MRFENFPSAAGTTLKELKDHVATRGEAQYLDVPLSTLSFDERGRVRQNGAVFPATAVAVRNIANRVHVPFWYVEKVPTDIAVENLNYFLPSAEGKVRLVVENDVLAGIVPASYEPVRQGILAEALSHVDHGFELHGWRCDNGGLRLRFTSPEFTVEPKVGDILRAGVDVNNPDCEKGRGLDVTGAIFRLVCANGAVVPEVSFSGKIRQAEWRKPEELALHAVGYFERACRETAGQAEGLRSLAEVPIFRPDPEDRDHLKMLRQAAGLLKVPSKLAVSLAEAMLVEDETLFGLYNAVTRLGRDAADPELARRLERGGFRVVERAGELEELLAP